MLTKQYKTQLKLAKDAAGQPTGEVTAVVSVFGNVDVVGDRVVKGAFAKTLQSYKDSGDPIPMIWSHDWSNPMSHIGSWDASKAKETDEGLELTGRVNINDGNPIADQAYKLMSSRLVREFSFAYDVLDEAKSADGANELLDLALIEAGPTLKGANNETRLVAAKALGKVGRSISAKNEQALRDALEAIGSGHGGIKGVLDALDAATGKSESPVSILDEIASAEIVDETKDSDEEPEPHALAPVVDALVGAAKALSAYITPEVKDDGETADAPTDEPEPVVAPKNSEHDEAERKRILFLLENE